MEAIVLADQRSSIIRHHLHCPPLATSKTPSCPKPPTETEPLNHNAGPEPKACHRKQAIHLVYRRKSRKVGLVQRWTVRISNSRRYTSNSMRKRALALVAAASTASSAPSSRTCTRVEASLSRSNSPMPVQVSSWFLLVYLTGCRRRSSMEEMLQTQTMKPILVSRQQWKFHLLRSKNQQKLLITLAGKTRRWRDAAPQRISMIHWSHLSSLR